MTREEEIRKFNAMVPKAAKLHVFTWCIKHQHLAFTSSLDGEECCNCKEFIGRGGACDPL